MSEIKLNRRYPESRLEDVTDAYMRGVEVGRAMRMDESEKLRELVRELYDELDAATQYDAGGGRGVVYEFADRMRELLGNVDALERRIERIERLLSHKTGKLAGNDFGAVFLDELGQEEQGGADELADD